jgi:hypothetical protein
LLREKEGTTKPVGGGGCNPRPGAPGPPFSCSAKFWYGGSDLLTLDRWQDRDVIELAQLVEDFAAAIRRADSRRPQAVGSRTGRAYQPGIGPHTENQTLRLVVEELVTLDKDPVSGPYLW